MKKTLLLLIAIVAVAAQSFATTWTIDVANFQFTPASLTGVHTGDTVKWMWSNGSHTTTSVSIPTGAASWNNPIEQATPTFSYVPSVAGTYSYQCTPHAPNMAGTFTVTTATGIGNVNGNGSISLYPNPAINSVHVDLTSMKGAVQMTIVDVAGRIVERRSVTGGAATEVTTSQLANGNYTLQASGKGLTITERFTVAH